MSDISSPAVLMDARRLRPGTGIARVISAWKERAERDGAPIRFLTVADLRDRSPWPTEPRDLRKAMRASRAWLFHATYPHTLLPSGVPTLFSLHDVIQLKGSLPRRAVARALIGRNLRVAGQVLTVSNAAADAIATSFDFPRERVHVVPNGVDLPPDRSDTPLGDHMLYVGNCKEHKHMGALIEWSSRALPARGLRLVAVVPSSCRDQLGAESAAGVSLVSNVPDDELARLRSSAVLGVSLARDEGFGLPPLEAAAYGAPSVLLDAGAHREVMADGAVYCELSEPSFRLALDDALSRRDELARQALARARELTWDHSWTLLRRLYEELSGEPR